VGDDLAVYGQAESPRRRDDKKRHGVDGREGARRQHRALNSFLSPAAHERAKVGEVAEVGPVHGRLGPRRQRLADLRDDDSDLAGGHLDPWVPDDLVGRPELEPDARHQQVCLVARLALERDRGVGSVVGRRDPLDDQADLRRPDDDDRSGDRVKRKRGRDDEESFEQNKNHLSCLQRARTLPFMRGCAQPRAS
jgi:hypothetical protein